MIRRVIYIMCLAVFAPLVGGAQGPVRDNPTMSFEHVSWDFGRIKEADGKVSYTFRFINAGGDAFVIENVSVSCGCTRPTFSTKPVLPGGRSEITVTYDPAGRPGGFDKDIYVTSDRGRNRVMLTIKGDVEGKPRGVREDYPFQMGVVRFDRLSLNFGRVAQGVPVSMTIRYANTSKRAVELKFEQQSALVRVNLAESRVPAGGRGEVSVTYDVPRGSVYGRVPAKFFAVIDGRHPAFGQVHPH